MEDMNDCSRRLRRIKRRGRRKNRVKGRGGLSEEEEE